MTFRPQRQIFPSAKLTADNAGELELPSHRKAVASAAARAQLRDPSPTPSAPGSSLPPSSPPPHEGSDDDTPLLAADPPQTRTLSKRPSQVLTSSPPPGDVIIIS